MNDYDDLITQEDIDEARKSYCDYSESEYLTTVLSSSDLKFIGFFDNY